MRYRSRNTWADISCDVAAFINLIGEGDYRRLLGNLHRGLNQKGYVTETDDLRFSLELQLLNLDLIRKRVAGQFPGAPESIHEATDFVIGLGQTIPHLSVRAQAKLRGQIVGGLKTNGLRPLQHEMRVAGLISKLGCNVTFADLEGDGGYDFLAEKDGLTYEIEGKSLPIFSGQPILPQDADKLFVVLRQKFDGWKDTAQIPILDLRVKNRLSTRHADLLELVEACSTAAAMKKALTIGSEIAVQYPGAVPDTPKVALAARLDSLRNGINLYVSQGQPKIVVRLSSEKSGRFVHNVLTTISDASKRQLSGNRPGIIWVHVDYVSPDIFDSMAHAKKGSSLFDLIALAVLDSPKRDHIAQLVFSGGAHLVKQGEYQTSSFRRIVYTSPRCKFREAVLFREGKQLTKRDQPPRGPVAKALLKKAILNVAVAPGQSKGPIAVYADVVVLFGSGTELPQRELVAAALLSKGNALCDLNRSEDAVAVCDDLLARLGDAPELSLREGVATTLFNKGVALSELGRGEEAITVYDEMLARFGSAAELPLREQAARALVNKAATLNELGHGSQAIAVCDDLLARLGSASDMALDELVAMALVKKGDALGKLGQNKNAIAVLDDLLARFNAATEPRLTDVVVDAKSLRNAIQNRSVGEIAGR